MKYTIAKTSDNQDYIILENGDLIIHIPTDPANSDYQSYLKYLEEQNA